MSIKVIFSQILSRFDMNSNDNYLMRRLEQLEDRVQVLEEENIEMSNALYECWNSLDARIDILAPHKLDEFNLGDK